VCSEHDGIEKKVTEQKIICLTLSDSTIGEQPNCPSKAPMNVQVAMLKLHYVLLIDHLFFFVEFSFLWMIIYKLTFLVVLKQIVSA
jgi:hypothetical protein